MAGWVEVEVGITVGEQDYDHYRGKIIKKNSCHVALGHGSVLLFEQR